MPIQADVLMTVFSVSGLGALLGAFEADAAAQQRLALVEAEVNAGRGSAVALNAAFTSSVQTAAAAETAFAGVLAGIGMTALHGLIDGLHDAIDAYVSFGQQVMNLQSLSGASAMESARQMEVFRVAGIKSAAAQQEILHLSHDLTSGQGMKGLMSLGITPQAGENSLDLMDRVLGRLRMIPDGLQKTAIEQEIFGQRGVVALQPLLRMTQAQADAAGSLEAAFNGEALAAIQDFTIATNMLGETFLTQIVYPLAQQVLPAITWVAGELTGLINIVGRFNDAFGGLPLVVATFAALGGAIGMVTIAVGPLVTALKGLALVEAVVDAFSGQWGNLAAGLAVGAAVGIGLYGATELFGGQGNKDDSSHASGDSALNANTRAQVDNTSAILEWLRRANWSDSNRGGVPKGLGRGDVGELARQHRLRTIG